MVAMVLTRRDMVSLNQRYGDSIMVVPSSAFISLSKLIGAGAEFSCVSFKRKALEPGVDALLIDPQIRRAAAAAHLTARWRN
jgi:hypothetical protein